MRLSKKWGEILRQAQDDSLPALTFSLIKGLFDTLMPEVRSWREGKGGGGFTTEALRTRREEEERGRRKGKGERRGGGFELFVMIKKILIMLMLYIAAFLPSYGGESAGCSLKKESGGIEILFPENIKGLKKGEVSTYSGDKLYLVIDGEAEIFERYGYLNMQAVSYEGKDGVIQVQVSDMGNNLAAFGLFSYYTNKHGKFVKMGSDGFQEEHSLYFYKGRFFVQVQHLKGKNAGELLENVSREISGILPDEPVKPVEIGYFPTENLIKYTLRYIPKSFMGYGFLPPAFEASYQDEKGESFRVFILMAESGEKAEESMAKMKEKVKNAVMVREGKNVAGAVNFRDKEKAEGLIKKILECMGERKRKAEDG